MDLSAIDAIIFDSDGVLVDSEVIHLAVEMELLAELGLDYDHATYVKRFLGLSPRDFNAALSADYAAHGLGQFPRDFSTRLQARVWPRIDAELQPVLGIEAVLKRFAGPVAVASSAPTQRLHRKLEIAGLKSHFEPHIYSADVVQTGKPAPDLFLHAAQALDTRPERCLVLEDSPKGIQAGRAANMLTVGFIGGQHVGPEHAETLKAAGAHAIVASHDELRNWL